MVPYPIYSGKPLLRGWAGAECAPALRARDLAHATSYSRRRTPALTLGISSISSSSLLTRDAMEAVPHTCGVLSHEGFGSLGLGSPLLTAANSKLRNCVSTELSPRLL